MLLKNSFFYILSSLIPSFIGLVLIPYYLRFISLEDFGTLSIIISSSAFLTILLSMQLHSSIVKLVQEYKNEVFFNVLAVEIGIYFIGFLLFLVFKDVWEWSGWLFLISVLNSLKLFFESISRSLNRGADILIGSLLNSIGVLSSIWLIDYKIEGILSALVLGYLIEIFYLFFLHFKRFVVKLDLYIIKEAILFSIPLIPHTLLKNVYVLGDRYILLYFVGERAVGVYSVLDKVANIVKLFTSNFGKAFLPYFLSHRIQIRDIIRISNLIFILIVYILWFGSEWILDFFKEGLREYKDLIFVLSYSFVFKNLEMFLVSYLIDLKKTVYISYISLIGGSLNIILNFIFIPLYGLDAAIYSTLLSYIATFLASYYFVCIKFKVFLFPKDVVIITFLGFFLKELL